MSSSKSATFYGWWIVAASFLVLFVSVGVGLYAPPVFLIPLQEHFGWSRAEIAGGGAMAALTAGVASPLAGVWVERFGAKRVMLVGAVVMGAAFGSVSTVHALWQFYALNVVSAIGLSCLAWVPNQTLVSHWFVRRRGLAMGLTLTGIGFGGLAIAPLASGLISTLGWRAAYFALGAAVLFISGIAVLLVVRDDPSEIGALPDGDAAEPSTDPAPGAVASELPGLEIGEALRTSAFWVLSLGHFLWTFASMSVIAHLAAFLTDEGFDSEVAAACLGLSIGVSVLGRLGFGLLADRRGKRTIMSTALVLHALAVLFLFRVDAAVALPGFVVLFGLGIGGGAVLVPLLVGECFGLRSMARILGLVMVSATLGAATGPVITGRIFDVSGSYQMAFVMHAVSFACGALAIQFLRRPAAASASPAAADLRA